jgi:hypothetical protein
MSQDINKKIIDKINESNFEPAIKEFLIKLLIYELDNVGEARWRFSDKYDASIRHFSEKYKGGQL